MEAKEEIRKVFKLGACLVFVIPKGYTRTHNIQAGDQIRVFYNDLLHAQPIKKDRLIDRLEKAKEILTQES
jgi:antitoxin component of MazEF toxin-antitoxin module